MWCCCPRSKRGRPETRWFVVASGMMLALGVIASPAETADEPPGVATTNPPARKSAVSSPSAVPSPPLAITLETGQIKNVAVSGITRVAIGDPAILDVTVVSSSELLLRATAPGTTNLLLWDANGQRSFTIEVIDRKREGVDEQLRRLIQELRLPSVQVKREESRLFLVGDVPAQQDLDRIEQLLSAYKEQVTNLVRVASKEVSAAAPPHRCGLSSNSSR